jgi:hypothetical protein
MPPDNKARVNEIEDELDNISAKQILEDFAFQKALRDAQRNGWSAEFQKKREYIAGTNERAKRRDARLDEIDSLTP